MTNKQVNIDWNFIEELEGALITNGYVPSSGTSGVTIASGYDIGQHSISDLVDLGIGEDLVIKLVPYTEIKGEQAEKKLAQYPLFLTAVEVNTVNFAVQNYYAEQTASEYNQNSEFVFQDLDREKQTVICSVAFQYGSLKNRCPRFFSQITKGLWKAAVDELDEFGDKYPTRRHKESLLLLSSLK